MPELSKTKRLDKIRTIQQISENHCGPAVVQMLLENIGIETTQELITKAGGSNESMLDRYGMRVDQFAKAVFVIAPTASLWTKEKATVNDIKKLLEVYDHPVGIEWQGLFEDSLEEEDPDEDYGHYSIVSHVDEETGNLIIVDPYKDFVDRNRIVSNKIFVKRWWDNNAYMDEVTCKLKHKKDVRLLFIIADNSETFPEELGLTKVRQASCNT
ncbi:hypothetical protein A3K34_02415 [candidate division WWE3 bacterium RIFOXYC1_FULL_40_10]|uniref:Peptidase C39-like domain-containing protein n=1 Tax=candidate division WWE3 bacterium RIFOXYA2_FULL_46_9 TaxID=1802636 RepID=A0A1F4W2P2_UNCKA|nr:MAG: hypothetical protein A3K58_02415 [candidate division WWE3 bacterium RIFOXYB1_FULL_40_22]OGC61705.1 MAG: hypothetical protein A3K37_02415 [candidate division WWE3 bacterium RIFOXYA1_FULL_40_11]OGC63689.1 MAG: hypothetical protein A2264_04905 [candidate division WWE3 bacterium RIFOXYA2_FULL_46_9]OGC64879.1 MAG: hypothetical protein A2326_01240 [candidate division WWE3 bacterium RIFOXYB2_FULL_41_6]OGC66088.1 MAG: hypothetical protein A3K34_02415 [candidate division WWE3 bacterium RIFOXYC1_